MVLCKSIALFVLSFALQAACHPVVEQRAPKPSTCSRNSFELVSDDGGIWPYRKYKSSNATPPQFVNQGDASATDVSDDLIFLTVENAGLFGFPGLKQERSLMMAPDGDLVWAGQQGNTSNFRTQVLHGEPVITYWTGAGAAASNGGAAHGYGTVEILDTNYNKLYSVCPKINLVLPPGTNYSCAADVHESYITTDNTIVITVYNITQADLTSVGGPKDGWVYDPLVVELDLETNEPIFIWDPLEHVPIANTHELLRGAGQNQSNPFDWFHMNSIQPFNGSFFVNSRQTWQSYYVDRNGSIVWQIDGQTGGDFGKLPPGGQFSWQHYARIQDYADGQVLVTYFADNNGSPLERKTSVGLGLVLNVPPNKAHPPTIDTHLVDQNDHVYSYAEGSYATLDNGNYFVGYGIRPVFKEFGPDSKTGADVLLSTQYGYINLNNTASSYRTYKQSWHATPHAKPRLVVENAGSSDPLTHCAAGSQKRGYISWNGATDVTDYQLFAGMTNTGLKKVSKFHKAGFETEFVVPASAKYIQIAAIENGSEVGRSVVVKT